MDYVTRQFIFLAKKFRKEIRKGQESLHRDVTGLSDRIKNLKHAVTQQGQSNCKSSDTPAVAVTELRTQVPIQVETKTKKTKPELIWAVFKGALEAWGIVAVILYTIFAYQQWQEMTTANAISMGNYRRARIDANGQLKESRIQTETTLRVMRVDQRPWIYIPNQNETFPDITDKAPLVYDVKVSNVGKTVAREVASIFVLAIVRKGKEPNYRFDDPDYPAVHSRLGAVFPSDPVRPVQAALVKISDGHPIKRWPTHEEWIDIAIGNAYIVVYGQVNYIDGFGRSHWTRHCAGIVPISQPPHAPSKTCVDYNDTDHND